MNFATNLRLLREAAGLTQEELAHACGFATQSRIGNYEAQGKHSRAPKLKEIPLIANALGVSIGELFGESSTKFSNSHETRLDPVMLAETATAISTLYGRAGRVFKLEEEPERFLQAYSARLMLPEEPSSAEMFEFGLAVAAIFAPHGGGDGGDGSGKNLPIDRSTGGNVARRRGT